MIQKTYATPAFLAALLAALGFASAAQAHITLEVRTAPVGSYYKATLAVPHGCDGAATTAVRVHIPEGVVAVKPKPKAGGWTLKTQDGAYAAPVKLHGATVDHGVREISWSGNLPDAYFDEFTFQAYLAPGLQPGQKLYFPVVQECGQAVVRWIDTSGAADASHPAPSLELAAPKSREH